MGSRRALEGPGSRQRGSGGPVLDARNRASGDDRRGAADGLSARTALPAVREIERCAKKGLKGVLGLASDAMELPYSARGMDALWRVASEPGMPISLHKPLVSMTPTTPAMPTASDLQIHIIHVVEQCITRLIYGGVFDRFPKLKIVSAENDVGWIPNWIHRLEPVYSVVPPRKTRPEPSS